MTISSYLITSTSNDMSPNLRGGAIVSNNTNTASASSRSTSTADNLHGELNDSQNSVVVINKNNVWADNNNNNVLLNLPDIVT